jgi:hypothetical protein
MTEDLTYNGWKGFGNRSTAYATWKLALELFEDDSFVREYFAEKPSEAELGNYLADYAHELVYDASADKFVTDLAESFLGFVNFREIAENILADWPEE